MKLHVFEGLGALFGTFFINFLSFFLNVPPISPTTPEGERAKRARLTRDADSRCTLAGAPYPVGPSLFTLRCDKSASLGRAPPEGERAKRARLTRDADSRCTLAVGASHFRSSF